MAILHKGSTISPTKPELLETILGGPVDVRGAYRFDDPEGEVGVEAFVVSRGEETHHVVLTYRAAPLDGAEEHLVSTMDHSVLGQRWVYDGAGDPVAVACFRRAVLGEQDQADLELWEGHERTGTREQAVRLSRVPGSAHAEAALTIATRLDVPLPDTDGPRLVASWDAGEATVAFLG